MIEPGEIKKVPILNHLSDSDLEKLIALAVEREFPAGEIIFAERSEEGSLFIILSGRVSISKATHSGEQKTLTTLHSFSQANSLSPANHQIIFIITIIPTSRRNC